MTSVAIESLRQTQADGELLRVTELTVQRGGRVLSSNLSFSLNAGEGLHLLGTNGAGKTSLLRVLAGLSLAESGCISRLGQMIYLGHSLGLKPELSVTENLAFYAGCAGVNDISTAIDSALLRVNLPHYVDALVQTLSAGQRRRVGLARLLIEPAAIWLLDEPFAALDARSVAWLCAELDRFMSHGGAVILTSHQDVATRMPLRELTVSSS